MNQAGFGRRLRERFEEERRTGDVTITSVVVCVAILLLAILKKYFEQ
jgi:hypothetical protein